MPERNRVTPFGKIEAITQRGAFMGNRGQLHRGHEIVRPWRSLAWITCALSFKGRAVRQWDPNRYTPLFFFDEAVALAAGHRPCFECRRADHRRWCDAWESAFGERPRANDMDRALHADRVDGRQQRRHIAPWESLPDGTYVVVDGAAMLVNGDRLLRWSAHAASYETGPRRPAVGDADVLTPSCTVEVLRHGYAVVVTT